MVRLRIKELAEQQKMNQKTLADKSGLSVQQINRYWNYPMQRVELDALVQIARALGVKFEDLLEIKDKEVA